MKTTQLRTWIAALGLAPATAIGATHYVDVNGLNAIPPYLDWSTAATRIQDAVAVAQAGETVLVTNGVYESGGATYPVLGGATNRVLLTNAITLLSVNGPQYTLIKGRPDATRCAVVGTNAIISGFTLTNGTSGGAVCQGGMLTNCVIINCSGGTGAGVNHGILYNCLITRNTNSLGIASAGGGVSSGTLYNCIVTSNVCTAAGTSTYGGGGYGCTFYNCVLRGNVAPYGGGAASSSLYNCTVVGNIGTSQMGGVYNCTLFNSIIRSNSAPSFPDGFGSSFTSCSLPSGYAGPNCFTNDPLLADVSAGNLHLKTNSPCINAGDNRYVTNAFDLDFNPRVTGGTVDIGAYELAAPASIISYAWLQTYHLATDGSADYADPDGDGFDNWQEWKAGTNPTNGASNLRIISASSAPLGITVTWSSVNAVAYYLQRSSDLAAASSSFSIIQTNIVATSSTTAYTDTNAIGVGPFFYRIGVQ